MLLITISNIPIFIKQKMLIWVLKIDVLFPSKDAQKSNEITLKFENERTPFTKVFFQKKFYLKLCVVL